jgi:hypothetical protein
MRCDFRAELLDQRALLPYIFLRLIELSHSQRLLLRRRRVRTFIRSFRGARYCCEVRLLERCDRCGVLCVSLHRRRALLNEKLLSRRHRSFHVTLSLAFCMELGKRRFCALLCCAFELKLARELGDFARHVVITCAQRRELCFAGVNE